MKAPSHRLRFLAGLLLGGGVALWLVHGLAGEARREVAAETEQRKAVVALQALVALVERGDSPDELVRKWQAGAREVAQVRIARGLQLVASTAGDDKGDRAAPRRLQRDEKPLYDRSQRLASAVQGNRDDQGGRKPEIELEVLGGRRLLLAAPLEANGSVVGIVELTTAVLPPAPGVDWLPFALALLAALAAFGLAALALGERRLPLAVAAIACLAGPTLYLLSAAAAQVANDRRAGAVRISERVREQAALSRALGAPDADPSAWDSDAFRKPRGVLQPGGELDEPRLARDLSAASGELRRAFLAVAALGAALLLLAGLGALSLLGSTLRRNRQAYLYVAPAIAGMLLLVFYPFAYGITLSFTDSNLYNTNKSIAEIWVGLRNYADILGQFAFFRRTDAGFVINYLSFYWTLLFTIVWTVCNVTLGVTSGLFLALILNTRALALRPVYRVLLILPWAVPNYITALVWKGMFHQQFGVINQMLQIFGVPALNWFDRPGTSFLTALATNGWLSFPFMMVVALGALQSIPADLYEAARVDGASRWQQFQAITLPSLRPALIPAVILSVVWTFNMFNIIYLVTGGEPGGATEILVTQAYKYAFERYRYGYAAAYSTVIFGILLVYGTVQNRLSKATES